MPQGPGCSPCDSFPANGNIYFLLTNFISLVLHSEAGLSAEGSTARSDSPAPSAPSTSQEETERPPDPELEKRLLGYLSDLSLLLPTDSLAITNQLNSVSLRTAT